MLTKAANITIKRDLGNIDWIALATVYERAPLGKRDPEKLRRAFESSYLVSIALDGDKVIGAGRAISDGEYYSNVYDVEVLPEYQGKEVVRLAMNDLLERLDGLFVLLTTTVGKEPFYSKLSFRKHRTAMAIYPPSKRESAELYLEPIEAWHSRGGSWVTRDIVAKTNVQEKVAKRPSSRKSPYNVLHTTEVTEYWADAYDASEWRKHLVQRY